MLKTGIKLLHRNDEGVLHSFIGGSLWRNRQVTYTPNRKAVPRLGCGPLAVYEDTPEGLAAAMVWVRMYLPNSIRYYALYRCEYEHSTETSLWFTFNSGEKQKDWPRPMEMENRIDRNWVIGEIVKTENLPKHTALASSVTLIEEINVKEIKC